MSQVERPPTATYTCAVNTEKWHDDDSIGQVWPEQALRERDAGHPVHLSIPVGSGAGCEVPASAGMPQGLVRPRKRMKMGRRWLLLTGCAPSPRPFTPILTFPHQGGRDQTPLMSTPGLRGLRAKARERQGLFSQERRDRARLEQCTRCAGGTACGSQAPAVSLSRSLGGGRRPACPRAAAASPAVSMCAGFPVALPESHAVRSCPPPSVILRDVFDPQLVAAPLERLAARRDVMGADVWGMERHRGTGGGRLIRRWSRRC